MKSKVAFVVLFLLASTLQAETKFLRITKTEDKKIQSLDTAIVRYKGVYNPTAKEKEIDLVSEAEAKEEAKKEDKKEEAIKKESKKQEIVIDLVGVIHIGDKSYYEKLNKQFKNYDVVLYEMVAPPGTKPTGTRSDNPLAMFQKMIQNALGLEHQLEVIDYKKKNFVHADLSIGKMIEVAKKRGEDKYTFGLGIVRDLLLSMNKQKLQKQQKQAIPDIDPIALLMGSKKEGKKLKLVFAQTLESKIDAGLGKTVENSLIGDRNAACIAELHKQIKGGKKKIAIFYGAAHMPDFERRLLVDFGLKKSGRAWVTAWKFEDK